MACQRARSRIGLPLFVERVALREGDASPDLDRTAEKDPPLATLRSSSVQILCSRYSSAYSLR